MPTATGLRPTAIRVAEWEGLEAVRRIQPCGIQPCISNSVAVLFGTGSNPRCFAQEADPQPAASPHQQRASCCTVRVRRSGYAVAVGSLGVSRGGWHLARSATRRERFSLEGGRKDDCRHLLDADQALRLWPMGARRLTLFLCSGSGRFRQRPGGAC